MDRREHILIIVQNLPVPFDRRVWLEATSLRAAGYRVSVICPKKKMYTASFERLEGIDIHRYPLVYEADRGVAGYFVEFAGCWLAAAGLAAKIYAQNPFHAVHACNPPETYWLLARMFRPFGVKFVFDHHDLSPEMFVAKGHAKGSVLHRGLLGLEAATFASADLVIAVNESHKEIARERGGRHDFDLTVVRSGPRRGWGAGVPAEPSLRAGFQYMTCYLGEMCAQDGVDLLLESILRYRQRFGSDTLFVLVGGGPEHQRLRALASTLGLDPIVRFTGRIPDEELWRYLATADVCVDPDPLTEWSNLSTMNKILEYMAFARPIVAFELLENRRSALDAAVYVQDNDVDAFAGAVRALLEDEARRRAMGAYGRARFERELAWEISAETLVSSYDRLFGHVVGR